MLHEFISANRPYIMAKCDAEMLKLAGTKKISAAMQGDWNTFLDQLGELLDASAVDFYHWKSAKSPVASAATLPAQVQNGISTDHPDRLDHVNHLDHPDRLDHVNHLDHPDRLDHVNHLDHPDHVDPQDHQTQVAEDEDILEPTAARRGQEYLRMGYTLSDVVHAYGIVCQAVTASAAELHYTINSEEFGRLNLALDIAIAAAVTQYEKVKLASGKSDELERLGFLAHELRNALTSAFIALELVERGDVGARGQTAKVLNRSLQSMKMLIDSALLAVRLKVDPQPHLEWVDVLQVASDIEVTAAIEARNHVVAFKIVIEPGLAVFADRQHFVSAFANLLQNAVKFSHPGTIVEIRGKYKEHRAYIEIEDRCGGLPKAKLDALFTPFEQMSENRSGLGLGLTISRRAIQLSDGVIYARDLPGKGCVFTIELPGRTEA